MTHCGSRNSLRLKKRQYTRNPKESCYTPVNSTINKLLSNCYPIVLPIDVRKWWHTTDSLTEQTISHRQDVRFVNDGQMLGCNEHVSGIYSNHPAESHLAWTGMRDLEGHFAYPSRSTFCNKTRRTSFFAILPGGEIFLFDILFPPINGQ